LFSACDPGITLLKQGIIEGENPVHDPEFAAYDTSPKLQRTLKREFKEFEIAEGEANQT
jgi:hypothetical protein